MGTILVVHDELNSLELSVFKKDDRSKPELRYFPIYSYPMVSAGKVVVSVSTMDVDAVPEFSVSAVPDDYFIQLTLGGAKYPLWGSCLLVEVSVAVDSQ